jgi:diguanylate cyclase (GGDEF)-like protein
MSQKILLLDDDPHFRELMAPWIRGRGYELLEAGTAAQASEILKSRKPDLAVVDGVLPDQSGVSWIAALREAGLTDLRIIYVSALVTEPTALRRLTSELGVWRVLAKPLAPENLLNQIDSALAARAKARSRAELDRVLARLRDEYGRSLPARAQELCYAVAKGRASQTLSSDVRMLAHRLHGTAGSYGFHAVGESAGRVETLLGARDDSTAPAIDWVALDGALLQLRRESAVAGGAEPPPPATRSQSNVLVVDSDQGFLWFAQENGRRGMVHIVPAGTAEEALSLARTTLLDAAFVDAQLSPPGAGLRLARQLRALPGCADLPVAVLSNDGHLATRLEAVEAGAALCLTKPLSPQGFAESTLQLIGMRTRERGRVVIVDDDADFLASMTAALEREGLAVTRVTQTENLLEVLEASPPDVLLLDVMMAPHDGFALCRSLRISPRWQDLPILFLTASGSAETRLQAFRAGGDDFILKPVVIEELLARVRVRLDRARLTRERFHTDPLTGLPLRRPFLQAFSSRLAEAGRHRHPLTLALIDIDLFKRVNDTHGHLVGDNVLSLLGHLLRERFRQEDLRARWGGEEFVLAFPREAPETVKRILERVLADFGAFELDGAGGRFTCTFTAGLAAFPTDGTTVESLLRVADQALYRGKESGRNRVVILDPAKPETSKV